MTINHNSCEPIYQQIAAQLREQILLGKLKGNDMLPSIRLLAQNLNVSVITTRKAYQMLLAEGLVEAARGKGYFVIAQDETHLAQTYRQRLKQHLADAVYTAKTANMDVETVVQTLRILWDESGGENAYRFD